LLCGAAGPDERMKNCCGGNTMQGCAAVAFRLLSGAEW
jgi:hypothetical protein